MVWHTVGFQPAWPGWRAVYLGSEGRSVEPVAGWLTQHHRLYDPGTDRLIPDDEPAEQRVIAGVCTDEVDLSVVSAEDGSGLPGELWVILGPGQDEPDQAAERRERDRLAEERRKRR